jgi:hypothetical protein
MASASAATFVGSETCAACHRAEAELWRGSQHRLAMQHASDKTVLGDFNDARFDYYGMRSRFFRNNGKFFVETDGNNLNRPMTSATTNIAPTWSARARLGRPPSGAQTMLTVLTQKPFVSGNRGVHIRSRSRFIGVGALATFPQ